MVKHIVIHAVIGGIVAFVGALIHDLARMHDLGSTLVGIGIGYAVLSLCALIVPLYRKIKPQIDAAVDEKSKSRAYEDLLRFKKLFDEKIISQEEFDTKSRELKAKLL